MNFINFSYVTCWAQNLLIPPVYYSQQNITVVNAINEILLRFITLAFNTVENKNTMEPII